MSTSIDRNTPAPSADSNPIAHAHQEIPSLERWLMVMLSSFIPILLALAVSGTLRTVLAIAAGALFLAGLVLFVIHEKARPARA